ncbi:MAG TPA: R3H domain-containing nucleic acid-binding protein [Candidatus Paceibacterota bacterium]|jgi:spoIIIJ-associated protein|nr:R3H domain-containing nucleic acid-binding protein [Candidatus Paceibacterota bacterium]
MEKIEIQNLIKELIEKTGVLTSNINMSEEGGDNTWFSVEVNEPHFFIGRDGEGLYALNHLIRRIVENKMFGGETLANSSPNNILIDINSFQKKRVENVRAVAHMMGERARYFKSNIEVDPMSAFERRVVHEFLSEATDLKTESVGFGPTRRVVIKYIGAI